MSSSVISLLPIRLVFILNIALGFADIVPESKDAHATVKRTLGNIAISYASSEFGASNGARVKTLNVVKKMRPHYPNELPENMVRLPTGETSQYWPADMRKDVRLKIENPVFLPSDTTSYGYYTTYLAKQDKTGPMVFPSSPPDTRVKPKVISLGREKSRTLPQATQEPFTNAKPTKFTHWDGMKLKSASYPRLEKEEQFQPTLPSCIPKGQYTIVMKPMPKLLPLAAALKNGNIKEIKQLAKQLQEDPMSETLFTVAPPITQTSPTTTTSTTTTPARYVAPTKNRIIRKRINRRPKAALRELNRQRFNTTTFAPSTTTSNTTSTTSTAPSSTTNAETSTILVRRISRFYIFE